MGRPINKRFFGPDDVSNATASYDVDGNHVTAAVINAGGAGYSVADTLTNVDGTASTQATYTVVDVATIAAQDETDYVASFVGGTGYNVGNVITMDDGSTITVAAEAGNVVTEFDITTASTSGLAEGATITAVSDTGTGNDDFTMTLVPANQKVFSISLADGGSYSVDPTLSGSATSGGAGTGATVDNTMDTDGGTVLATYVLGGSGYADGPLVVNQDSLTFTFTVTGGVVQGTPVITNEPGDVLDATGVTITMPASGGTDGGVQILGTAWIPGEGAAEAVHILRQRSSRRFHVASNATPATSGICLTVDGPTPAEGEFVIPVEPSDGAGGSTGTEYAKIITGRRVRTFQGNSYGWGDLVIDTVGEGGPGPDLPAV